MEDSTSLHFDKLPFEFAFRTDSLEISASIIDCYANACIISNVQLLVLPSCLAIGPKIEVCNVTISSRVDEMLRIEYQE